MLDSCIDHVCRCDGTFQNQQLLWQACCRFRRRLTVSRKMSYDPDKALYQSCLYEHEGRGLSTSFTFSTRSRGIDLCVRARAAIPLEEVDRRYPYLKFFCALLK